MPPRRSGSRPPRAPRSAARILFDLFNADGSGAIELAEVGIALRFLGLYTDEKSAAFIFNEIDVDGSGACPTDVPAGVTAKPDCVLKSPTGDQFCAL